MQDYGISLPSVYDDSPEPDWFYQGWIPREDKIMVITGDGGVGKTIFVARLMLAMACGETFMARPFLGDPPRFLYIDLDMGEVSLRQHILNVAISMGLKREDLAKIDDRVAVLCEGMNDLPYGYDLGTTIDGKSGYLILRGITEKIKPDIVIMESWSDFCGDEVDMDSNNKVNKALRRLKQVDRSICWWIVHHEGKSKFDSAKQRKSVQHRGLGAQALCKSAHRNFSIAYARDRDGITTNVVEWGKVRLGAKPRNFEYSFGKNPDGRFMMEYGCEV